MNPKNASIREWQKRNPEKVKAYNEKYRKNHPEKLKEWAERYKPKKRILDRLNKYKYRKKHPEMRFGRRAWTKDHIKKWKVNKEVYLAKRKGILKEQPCEVCGGKKVHAHHDDYSRALDVRWLCPLHHKQEHLRV